MPQVRVVLEGGGLATNVRSYRRLGPSCGFRLFSQPSLKLAGACVLNLTQILAEKAGKSWP